MTSRDDGFSARGSIAAGLGGMLFWCVAIVGAAYGDGGRRRRRAPNVNLKHPGPCLRAATWLEPY